MSCTSCNTYGEKDAQDCLRVFPLHKKYNVIYADPPWRYESDGNLTHKPYPTMSFEELVALPVQAISAPESACFMWTSNPMLDKAIALMAAWGFTYKTVYKVWTKRSASGAPARVPGYWSMSSVELCLVGSRGGMQKYKTVYDEPQEHASGRGAHSEKPPGVRDSIRRLLDVPRRIELFARHICDGWDAWGLDVPGFVHIEGEPLVPANRLIARAFLETREDERAVTLRLRFDPIACRAAQTRTLTMRKPTFSPSATASAVASATAVASAPVASVSPAVATAAASVLPADSRSHREPSAPAGSERDRDRVPVINGSVLVRGPARPSRSKFEFWWREGVNLATGRRNRDIYRIPEEYLAANPDIRRIVEAE